MEKQMFTLRSVYLPRRRRCEEAHLNNIIFCSTLLSCFRIVRGIRQQLLAFGIDTRRAYIIQPSRDFRGESSFIRWWQMRLATFSAAPWHD
jgi:hypothetical protein